MLVLDIVAESRHCGLRRASEEETGLCQQVVIRVVIAGIEYHPCAAEVIVGSRAVVWYLIIESESVAEPPECFLAWLSKGHYLMLIELLGIPRRATGSVTEVPQVRGRKGTDKCESIRRVAIELALQMSKDASGP
jgi:hypothetical protein